MENQTIMYKETQRERNSSVFEVVKMHFLEKWNSNTLQHHTNFFQKSMEELEERLIRFFHINFFRNASKLLLTYWWKNSMRYQWDIYLIFSFGRQLQYIWYIFGTLKNICKESLVIFLRIISPSNHVLFWNNHVPLIAIHNWYE